MGCRRWGWRGVEKWDPAANDLLFFTAELEMVTVSSSVSVYWCFFSTDSCLSLSRSATAHPAFRHPLYFRGKAHVYCLRGVIWGHAHTHHLAQRWPAHSARFCLWRRNRDQRIHELLTNLQGDTEAQRKLYLHCQQRGLHCQLGETANSYWWANKREHKIGHTKWNRIPLGLFYYIIHLKLFCFVFCFF